MSQPAHAAGDVTATYGCDTVTFHNPYESSVTVSYGRYGTGDEAPSGAKGVVRIGQRSVTVKISPDERKDFGWKVWMIGNKEIEENPTQGRVDLTKYCAAGKDTGTTKGGASKAPAVDKTRSGGLAKTGV